MDAESSQHFNHSMFHGYDFDSTMLRIGSMNMLLHGLEAPDIRYRDSLSDSASGFRYIRPILPLGAHRRPMNPGSDLSLHGQVEILADLLDALAVDDVTLVHSDWGGGLFLTAHGRDQRVAAQVVLPCEAFDNFPPGLPGFMVKIASRLPGGLQLAARQLRVGWLRRLPILFGQMAARPIPDDVVRAWTEPVLTDPRVRADLLAYCSPCSTSRKPWPGRSADS